jgi:hypothetical protein
MVLVAQRQERAAVDREMRVRFPSITPLHLLADASGEAIRLSNGTRWVRFPRRALRPSCVSGLRVRLKPGRSRFDSGGGHCSANRSMAERRHDEAEMSVRFALRAPRSIGGAVGTGHCLASRDKRVRLPPPPLPCRANGSSPEKRETGTAKAAPMTCYLDTRVWVATRVADAPLRGREVAHGKRVSQEVALHGTLRVRIPSGQCRRRSMAERLSGTEEKRVRFPPTALSLSPC